jgi:hypothetical protein
VAAIASPKPAIVASRRRELRQGARRRNVAVAGGPTQRVSTRPESPARNATGTASPSIATAKCSGSSSSMGCSSRPRRSCARGDSARMTRRRLRTNTWALLHYGRAGPSGPPRDAGWVICPAWNRPRWCICLRREPHGEPASCPICVQRNSADELPADLADPSSRRARIAAAKARLDEQDAMRRAELAARLAAKSAAEETRTTRGDGRPLKEKRRRSESRANITDPDSSIMRDSHGYLQGYNAQAAVTANQVIVAADVTQEPSDTVARPVLPPRPRDACPFRSRVRVVPAGCVSG